VLEAIVRGRVKEPSTEAGVLDISTNRGGDILTHYLIVTDRRVLIWARGAFQSSLAAYRFEDIRGVEHHKGAPHGAVVLNVRGKAECFAEMDQGEAELVGNLIRKKVSETRKAARAPARPATQGQEAPDPVARLRKLKSLLKRGLITQAEFDDQIRKLRGRI
jgi:hypothetical protein